MKIHKSEGKKIIAICDKELIGRVLEEGDLSIDLDKYKAFYVGEETNKERIMEELKDYSSINVVGIKSVNILVNQGIVDKKNVMHINTIPYIQIYNIYV